jgi:hypothetical protein
MGLVIEGEYYKKSRDAGPYIPISTPSDKFMENYDNIQWDKPEEEKEK